MATLSPPSSDNPPATQPSQPEPTDSRTTTLTTDTSPVIPMPSPLRTQPIHPLLPSLPILPTPTPSSTSPAAAPHTINPLTLSPFTANDLHAHNFKAVLSTHPTPQSAAKAQEEAVLELKRYLEGQEKRRKEIEREIREAENIWAVERRIYEKAAGGGGK